MPRGDGYYEFYSVATDLAGNVENAPEAADARCAVDRVPPGVAIASPEERQYIAKRDNILIDFEVSDAVDPSPTFTAYLTDLEEGTRVDVGDGQEIDPLSIDDGFWILTVEASDSAGNASSENVVFEVVHDIQPPRTSIEVGTPQCGGDRLYVTSATSFTLSAVDDLVEVGDGVGLGVALTEYRIDGGPWTTYGAPFTVSAEGPHTVSYRSVDAAGNVENVGSLSVVVDDTPPESSVWIISPYWRNAVPFTITATASDDLSGVASVELRYRYSPDNGTWSDWRAFGTDNQAPWEWSFDAPEGDGFYEFYAIGRDRVTNVERAPDAADARCGVDTVAPISSVDQIGSYWQNSVPFTIAATAEDPAPPNGAAPSGLSRVRLFYRYSPDNSTWGPWKPYGVDDGEPWSWSFDAPDGDGYYEFYTVAGDVARNAESPPAAPDARCGVDATPPVIAGLAPEDGAYIKDDRPIISVTLSDATSGVAPETICMTLNGQSVAPSYDPLTGLVSYAPPQPLPDNAYVVALEVADLAGNENFITWGFTIDTIPPISSVNAIEPYWRGGVPITVTAAAYDPVPPGAAGSSGVERVELWYRHSPDNSTWGEWTLFGTDEKEPWGWTFDAPDGFYEFCSVAIDRAGNVEDASGVADAGCCIDTAPPAIENLRANPHVFTPHPGMVRGLGIAALDIHHRRGETTVSYVLSDALSPVCLVSIEIYDLENDLVRVLFSGAESASPEGIRHEHPWDGRDGDGEIVPDGPYALVVSAVDLAGNRGGASTSAVVDARPFRIRRERFAPRRFNPELGELTELNYTLSEPAEALSVTIYHRCTPVRHLVVDELRLAGPNSEVW
ncbi:MAG: hypothetical protein J7M38_02270, partial [Armatimonadetes bacterium]|nr:hypothetical protein [Armatimonadota bacterium]